jgi:hypothetical protein
MAHSLCQLQSDVHYCYLCYDWVIGDQWVPHCQSHLDGLMTKRCGSVTSCYTLVRPAYCPFCIGKLDDPAPKRLQSWTRDRKLWDHIRQHHLADCLWPGKCPHPLCDVILEDYVTFEAHLVNEHGLTRPGKTTAKRSLEVDDAASINGPTSSTVSARKRRKVEDASYLAWMPSSNFQTGADTRPSVPSYRPSKRSRHSTLTVSPPALSLRPGGHDPYITGDNMRSPLLCPIPVSTSSKDKIATSSQLSGTTVAQIENRSSRVLRDSSEFSKDDDSTGQEQSCGKKQTPRIILRVQ